MPFLEQRLETLGFLADKGDLAFLGGLLGLEPMDVVAELRDAVIQDLDLAL